MGRGCLGMGVARAWRRSSVSDLTKLAPKPPFANYDLVVYFGGGLFALPVIHHFYFRPLQLTLQPPLITAGSPTIDAVLTVLFFLFFAYIIGHGLAYASGQIIQKGADGVFGKTSGVIIWESLTNDAERRKRTQELILHHLSHSFEKYNWLASAARALFHLPILPFYFVIFKAGVFGFYGSRVPEEVIGLIRRRLALIGLPEIPVAHRGYWFKPLEHYVMNNFPVATARMYNYLVISGLFRSMALIFLLCIWLQGYYDIHWLLDNHIRLAPILGEGSRAMPLWQLYLVLVCSYFICLFSFLKFQRRYVEEAMFAFALTRDNDLAQGDSAP